MSIFQGIDSRLFDLAERLKAKLTKDRPEYPEFLRTFEERRIDWTDNGIRKAIAIQPNFESDGVNSKIWNFTILAWVEDEISQERLQWVNNLVVQKKFEVIEENIERLIHSSEEALNRIQRNDLKHHEF